MKLPDECLDIEDVRVEIDSIDKKIITLIGQRAGYVKVGSKIQSK